MDRGGFDGSNPEWKKGKNLPEELRKVKLYESPGHQRNFLDCVKSRQPTIAPVQTAHHSAIPGHLGLISMLTGRKIHWDVNQRKNSGRRRRQQIALAALSRAVAPGVMGLTGLPKATFNAQHSTFKSMRAFLEDWALKVGGWMF